MNGSMSSLTGRGYLEVKHVWFTAEPSQSIVILTLRIARLLHLAKKVKQSIVNHLSIITFF